jgi:hypothetical protein
MRPERFCDELSAMEQVHIQITLDSDGLRAGSPDLPDFQRFASSFQEMLDELPGALQAHCGRSVNYKVTVHTSDASRSETVKP